MFDLKGQYFQQAQTLMEIFSAADISFHFNSRVIADIFSKFFGEKHKKCKNITS